MKRITPLFSLFSLVLKRLRHHAALSLASAAGILSILSLVVCEPIFANGVLSKVLQEQLTDKAQRNHRSLFSLHMYYNDPEKGYTPLTIPNAHVVSQYITTGLEDWVGVKVAEVVLQVTSKQRYWTPVKVASSVPFNKTVSASFDSSDVLATKIELVEGVWPQEDFEPSGPIPVAVLEDFADIFFLNVGDIYQSEDITVQVVGVFRALDPDDPAWFYQPETTYRNAFWVPLSFFETVLPEYIERPVFYTAWYAIAQDNSLRFSNSLNYTHQMVRLESALHNLMLPASIDYSPLDMLTAYEERMKAMTVLFYAAGAPMLALALFFTGLTASIAVRQYETETAVMGARGGSPVFMTLLNLAESLVLILVSLPLALLIGRQAAALMGRTQLFLTFTRSSSFVFSLEDANLIWLGLAAAAILVARLLPLLGQGRPGALLTLKQERSRSSQKPFWERYYLDLMLLIPSAYAYFNMRERLQGNAVVSEYNAANGYDPLTFLASSLFIIALCMLVLRLLPWMMRLLGGLVGRLPQAWSFLAIQEIARSPRDHATALLLVMISLSFAIFTASMAKTLDRWLRDVQYYQVGADLVVKEYELPMDGGINFTPPTSPTPGSTRAMESMISLDRHLQVPDIRSATYVGKYQGNYSYGPSEHPCKVMGIDRLTFPQTAFFRRDFANSSLGALMNDLAAQPAGVLIPQSLADSTGLAVGDPLEVEATIGVSAQLVIAKLQVVGIYDYFPTVYPENEPTLVTNLDALFGGPDAVTNVEVWLKLDPAADTGELVKGMSRMAARDALMVEVQGNALDAVRLSMRRPEWVGLFGVLNVGFLLTGLLPGIGFLLYSFASLRKRLIQFGILQALGLSSGQVQASLILEQVLLMGTALIGGAGVGILASALYLPFLQVGAAGSSPTPPFSVLVGWQEAVWLCLFFALVFVLALALTLLSLSRLKINQAIKMGEAV